MIRDINIDDLPQILEMENILFPSNPWTEDMFRYEMEGNAFSKIFVNEKNDEIVAYADLWIIYEQAQLANIAVKKEFQRQGIGQELLDYCIDYAIHQGCETVSLEVRVNNQNAISLYERNGFINAAVREKYYEDGTDAYLMIKPIGGLLDDEDFSN